jgi:hypothetical protein
MPGSKIGIRTISIVPAGVTTISNVVLATIAALSFPVLAGSSWRLKFFIPITTGATGGAKFQIICPAGPTLYLNTWWLYLAGTPGTLADTAVQAASASFANALAGAANHCMMAECFITASIAGTIGLQFAQNSSVAATLTIMAGGTMEVTQL